MVYEPILQDVYGFTHLRIHYKNNRYLHQIEMKRGVSISVRTDRKLAPCFTFPSHFAHRMFTKKENHDIPYNGVRNKRALRNPATERDVMKKIEEIKDPILRVFRTPHHYYLYSMNTDSVVEINAHIYSYFHTGRDLSLLEEADHRILSGLIDKGHISDRRVRTIYSPLDVRKAVSSGMEQLTLQVTQACNLTCSYCPYANATDGVLQRNHSSKSMDFTTARKAVDYFFAHSWATEEVVVSFYGGEPLLAFPLIRRVVEYIEREYAGIRVRYNMTTNATLFTDTMIEFLTENGFDILFSLDGPASIHDINRRRADGSGSFRAAYKKLQKVISAYGEDYQKHIQLNMVFDPANDLDQVLELFRDPDFPRGIHVMGDRAEDTELERPIPVTEDFCSKIAYQYFLGYLQQCNMVDGLDLIPFVRSGFSETEKTAILLEEKDQCLPDQGIPGGPCIPGKRRLFVSTDGTYYPCEKVNELSEAMKIGHVDTGIDFDKAERLLNIAALTPDKCRNCWAFHHCLVCQRYAVGDGDLDPEIKNSHCQRSYSYMDLILQEYALLRECAENYRRNSHRKTQKNTRESLQNDTQQSLPKDTRDSSKNSTQKNTQTTAADPAREPGSASPEHRERRAG